MLLNVQEAGLKRILSPINWETVNKMNDNTGVFEKVSENLPTTNTNNSEYFYSDSYASGIYYAVFHVYDTAELVFTD